MRTQPGRPYSHRRWRERVRPRILERDGHVCRIGLAGCTVIATSVDHIVELDAGGASFDERNLRAACHSCNSKRGRLYANAKREARPLEQHGNPTTRSWLGGDAA